MSEPTGSNVEEQGNPTAQGDSDGAARPPAVRAPGEPVAPADRVAAGDGSPGPAAGQGAQAALADTGTPTEAAPATEASGGAELGTDALAPGSGIDTPEEAVSGAEDPGEAGAGAEAHADAQDGAGKPKRKRKRKRKRKSSSGDVEAPTGEGEGKKRESAAPFARYFAGASPKRHAFAVGEVVAGRVQRVGDGAIVVDLFGKALAVADEFEPREVPPPQVVEEPQPQDEAAQETAEGAGESAPSPAVPEATAATPAETATTPEETPASEGRVDTTPGGLTAPAESPEAGLADVAAAPQPEPPPPLAAPPESPEETRVQSERVASQQGEQASRAGESNGAVEAGPATDAGVGDAPVQDVGAADAPVQDVGAADVPGSAEEGESTQAGTEPLGVEGEGGEESSHEAKGPLPPAPVVPESFPRPEPPKQGGIMKGRVGAVAESGHIVLLNRHVDRPAAREAIKQYREQRRRVEGLVFGYNRGGFDVLVQGLRAFCPASAMALSEITDPEELVGRKFEFLLPASKGGKDIVVSRRSILERQARKKAKELVKSLQPGQRFTGRVTSVREFGLFVDIGGVEGLVHQTEISHAFGVKPSSAASVGDSVEVQVLRIGDGNKKPRKEGEKKPDRRDRTTRVGLSIKALLPDPWDTHAEAIAEGTVREGKVTRTAEFGAFIELAPGIEGLLHISEFGRDLAHADQATKEGESIHVIVERADRKARRISLSRLMGVELEDYKKGALDPAAIPRNLRPGAKVTVRVDKADQRGVQVRLPGAIGRRARGFIPAGETGTDRGTDLRKRFPAGQDLEVKVIGNDRDGGLKCSVKALQIDEERKAVKDYRREASKQGFGTFGDLLKAKLGQ